MIFQTLDDKAECVGIYTNNELIFDQSLWPSDLKYTWQYAPYLRNYDNLEYVSLYLEGKPIGSVIPEYLQDDWSDISKKVQAFKRSLNISCVNMRENCFFDLVPQRFLIEYCEVRNKILQHVLNKVPRPNRYKFYKHVSMLLTDISHQPIALDERMLNSLRGNKKFDNLVDNLKKASPYVKYNQFGTKTGRLTTCPGTFPILTLNKSLRAAIKPQNDIYVEFDFNGAEVRTLLGILNKEQPSVDVHQYHLEKVFSSLSDREDAKVAFFAWLYGSKKASTSPESKVLETYYNKKLLLQEHWKNNKVTTPYGKVIHDVSQHHALNYLVQSTAAELTLKQAVKMDYLLRKYSSGSRISFLIHDAVVVDLKKEDEHLLGALCTLMQTTNFGNFVVNIKKGKTLGSLKEYRFG